MNRKGRVRRAIQLSLLAAILLAFSPPGAVCAGQTVRLGELDLTKMTAGWGRPVVDKSVQNNTLTIGGRKFDWGVGTHAASMMYIDLAGGSKSFSASVGVDDEVGENIGSIEFRIYGDRKLLWTSGVVRAGQPAKQVNVGLTGVKMMMLVVTGAADGVSYDHADWAEAKFDVTGQEPKAIDQPVIEEERIILTPKPGPEPRINGPGVYGARPGRPFIYRIPCTGQRPIKFAANKLPRGLNLDEATGIITGTTPKKPRSYRVTLTASNSRGTAKRSFTIVVGQTLALTPPMGWNH